jgi:AbiV family abortive infection protein
MVEDHFEATLANAERLLEDSKILSKRKRWKSAIILGVFAIEELGKALIERWGVRNEGNKREHPTHIEKQTATFALLAAKETLENPSEHLKHVEEEIPLIDRGPYHQQFVWARHGFFDDLRMVATYADKKPRWPEELTRMFGKGFVAELHGYFGEAVAASHHEKAMGLASEIYRFDLGRR